MNSSTEKVIDLINDEGWMDVAEEPIWAYCAKHWTSMVDRETAGALVRGALVVESDFILDLGGEYLADVEWTLVGEAVMETLSDRAMR